MLLCSQRDPSLLENSDRILKVLQNIFRGYRKRVTKAMLKNMEKDAPTASVKFRCWEEEKTL